MTSSVRTQSAQVSAMVAKWPLIDALLGGTSGMRAAGEAYLPKWPNEEAASYEARLKVATLYPTFAYTASVMASKPFSKLLQLSEDVPESIKEWAEDIDLQGRNLHSFAAELMADCMAHGLAGVLVDYPKAEGIKTRDDERKAGARPYFTRYSPLSILGWKTQQIAGATKLVQLRLLESVTEEEGEFGEKNIEQVRVLRPGAWEVWRKVEKKEDWFLYEEGKTTIQEIPFVFFYGIRKGFGVGLPPLLELAHLNVEHWQSSSDQQTILHIARVPILTVIGADSDTQITVGASSAVKLPTGSSMAFVEHSGAAIEAGRQSILDLEERMQAVGAELLMIKPGQVTATQTRSENEANKCTLQRITEIFEDALDQCLALMAKWVGEQPAGHVELFKDFGAANLSDASAQLVLNMQQGGVITKQTLIKEQQRRGVLSPDIDPDEELEAVKEEGPALGMTDEEPSISKTPEDTKPEQKPEQNPVDLSPILAAIESISTKESDPVDYSAALAGLSKQIEELSKKADQPQEAEIDLSSIDSSISALGEKIAALEAKPEPDDSELVRKIVADAIKPLIERVERIKDKPEDKPDIAAIVRAELAAIPRPSQQVMLLDPQTGAVRKQITLQYGADGKPTGATVVQETETV